MKIIALLTAAALAGSCYHEEHPATYVVGAQEIHARHGHVVQVHEAVRHPQTAVPGTASGAMLGGIVFHRGGAAVLGHGFGGAAPGAPDRRAFEVIVAFDDGETGIFVYQDWSPYRPGDRVLLTRDGLVLR